jgi:hypothetical protein
VNLFLCAIGHTLEKWIVERTSRSLWPGLLSKFESPQIFLQRQETIRGFDAATAVPPKQGPGPEILIVGRDHAAAYKVNEDQVLS